jgi:hypothetical protein
MNRLSNEDALQLAHLLCKKLALDIDAEDRSSIKMVVPILLELPLLEVIWPALTEIGVDRASKYNLDVDPDLNELIIKLNTKLNNLILDKNCQRESKAMEEI